MQKSQFTIFYVASIGFSIDSHPCNINAMKSAVAIIFCANFFLYIILSFHHRRGVEAQPLTNGYCGSWELDLQFGALDSSSMQIVNNQSLFLSSFILLIYFVTVFKSF